MPGFTLQAWLPLVNHSFIVSLGSDQLHKGVGNWFHLVFWGNVSDINWNETPGVQKLLTARVRFGKRFEQMAERWLLLMTYCPFELPSKCINDHYLVFINMISVQSLSLSLWLIKQSSISIDVSTTLLQLL